MKQSQHRISFVRVAVAGVVACTLVASVPAAAGGSKSKTKPKKVQATVPADSIPLVGTWVVFDGVRENPNTRVEFRKDGTFVFAGANFRSTGTFALRDNAVQLLWSTIDGDRVAPGSVKARYWMTETRDSFTIDRYTYVKRGSRAAFQ